MEQKEYKAICLHFNGKTEADQPALQGQECQHRYSLSNNELSERELL